MTKLECRGIAIVPINIAFRSAVSCGSTGKHSAQSNLDNCHRDYAQRNATELAGLLSGANTRKQRQRVIAQRPKS